MTLTKSCHASNMMQDFKKQLNRLLQPKFFGYPLLSQEREKLRISNLASTFRVSIRIKAHEKVQRKVSEHGRIQGLPNFFGYPLLAQERVKLRNSNFARTFQAQSEQKSINISGKVAVGVVRDSRKFSGHPYIGCIAQLSLRQLSFLVYQCYHTNFRRPSHIRLIRYLAYRPKQYGFYQFTLRNEKFERLVSSTFLLYLQTKYKRIS